MVRKHGKAHVSRKPKPRKARQPDLVKTTAKAVTDLVVVTGTLSVGTLAISKLAEMAKK